MSNKEIETVSSQVKYQNKWMTLREDVIRRESGQEGIYGVVDKPDFAIILPIDGDDVYLVEQYRYTIGERQMEFPQGAWESNPDADPKVLAAGELKEETGLDASELIYVGFQYLAYGFCSQGYHIFVAKGLTQGKQSLDPEEEGLTLYKLSLAEVEEKIRNGKIKDASTCNALGLAKLKGII